MPSEAVDLDHGQLVERRLGDVAAVLRMAKVYTGSVRAKTQYVLGAPNSGGFTMSARKVPSLRHHKARDLAAVTLGGPDFYCGKFGLPESRREYDRVVGEWLAAGRPKALGRSTLVIDTGSIHGGRSVAPTPSRKTTTGPPSLSPLPLRGYQQETAPRGQRERGFPPSLGRFRRGPRG